MAQYINKDALVAEIIRRRKAIPKEENDKRLKAVYGNEAFVLTELLEFIDTLEVKELDLDFEKELYKTFGQVKDFTLGMCIAKHFFELGVQQSKNYNNL